MFEISKVFNGSLLILGSLGISFLANQAPAAPAGKPAPHVHEAKSSDTVVMRVNDQSITRKQLDEMAGKYRMQAQLWAMHQGGTKPKPRTAEDVTAMAQRAARDELIGNTILRQAIDRQTGQIKEEAVQHELGKLKKDLAQKNITLDQFLKQRSMTAEDLRNKIKEKLAITILIEKEEGSLTPTNKEIRDAYERKKGQMSQVHASHILFGYKKKSHGSSSVPSAAEKAELKQKAEQVLKQVKAGEDFAALAKKYSSCPSAAKGGDLGFIDHGQMVPAFEEAAFKLKAQEVSEVVETRFGFHIIKVTEVKYPTFEEMQDRIKNYLLTWNRQAKMGQAVSKMRHRAKIEYFDQNLAKLKSPPDPPPMHDQ